MADGGGVGVRFVVESRAQRAERGQEQSRERSQIVDLLGIVTVRRSQQRSTTSLGGSIRRGNNDRGGGGVYERVPQLAAK